MKHILLCISILLIIFNPIFSQTKSSKRGLGYGYHSENDLLAASKGISWWYNWSTLPEFAVRYSYQTYNMEFVPMAWNVSGISNVETWAGSAHNSNYILGFNEPNFIAQANMTPKQAAAAWPQLQAIADKYGLKLVSPAVNYCGNCVTESGVTYTNPFKYLDDFFAACPNCRVDYIALHWYGCGNSMTGYINDARKYGKPIWITEFACWDDPSVTPISQKNYLAGTVNFLERDPDVFRYAWFIGRGSASNSSPYINLYGADGQLTDLGKTYQNIPVYNPDAYEMLPKRIQAEEYFSMSGVFSEITSDVDGFMNLGWIDAGDWITYKIDVPVSGNYNLALRIAGNSSGNMDILKDGSKISSINIPPTGGWQAWQTLTSYIYLYAGQQTLRFNIISGGFNLNWLQFSSNMISIVPEIHSNLGVNISSNPVVEGILKFSLSQNTSSEIQISLMDLTGKTIYVDNKKASEKQDFEININSNSQIKSGMYFLKINGVDGSNIQKIVIQ